MTETIKMCLLLVGLAYNGALDLQKRSVSVVVLVVSALVGIVFRIHAGFAAEDFFGAMLPGVIALAFAWITQESIGYGDGLLLLSTGCYCSAKEMLIITMLAIFYAAITGIVLLLFFHKSKNYEIPFAPFLFVACLAVRCFYALA